MAEYVARVVGIGKAFFADYDHEVAYLQSYNPTPPPTGHAAFTPSLDAAMKFASAGDAMRFTLQVHPTNPIRPDGRPNKPLTAYCWLFETTVVSHGR